MGAYSPSRLITKELENKILTKIIGPTIEGLKDMNCEYRGFLYAGLMIINNEPYLIEYNVRMGDPECQTILPKLNSDLFEIIMSCCSKSLSSTNINWHDKKSLCIVFVLKVILINMIMKDLIKNIDKIKLEIDQFCYHAGTKKKKIKFIQMVEGLLTTLYQITLKRLELK